MQGVIEWIKMRIINSDLLFQLLKSIEFIDIVQILIIAYFVYHLILWVKNTKAYQLLKGLIVIGLFVIVAGVFQMTVIMEIFKSISVAAITAVVIIFQPELRRVLEQLGDRNFINALFSLGTGNDEEAVRFTEQTLNEMVRATFEMSEAKTGALIVIEQNIALGDYEKTGIPIDAVLTGQLLVNIFEHNTPLHDGAVIVRNDRVVAATCYLPLSDKVLNKKLGTRHRAGVGISEVTDSLTIIVSEETGKVSYALNGELTTGITPSELKEQLYRIQKLVEPQEKNSRFKRWKGLVKHEKISDK